MHPGWRALRSWQVLRQRLLRVVGSFLLKGRKVILLI